MSMRMSSRDRIMAAISHQPVDHLPCCFMLFGALHKKSADGLDFVDRQLTMGLDAYAELPMRPPDRSRKLLDSYDLYGLPVRYDPAVVIRDSVSTENGREVIRREYALRGGKLTTAVAKTEDWIHGNRVPIFDDYVVPRAVKRLVTERGDIALVKDLLVQPSAADISAYRAEAKRVKAFASDRGVATAGEWGVLFDAACWLAGMEEMAERIIEEPEFVEELLAVIGEWNLKRMELVLEAKPDILVRRAWYETVDFMSPANFRKLVLPWRKREAKLAHEAGAKLGSITSSAYTPILDDLVESGMDVMLGLDPVQDARADFPLTKRKFAGKVALWGGVNGFVTIENGTPAQVRDAVRKAVEVLSPGGGFILSPVDNVREDNQRVWDNVRAFINEWQAVSKA